MFNCGIKWILILFRDFFPCCLWGYASVLTTSKACFRDWNSLKFKIFHDSAPAPAGVGLKRLQTPYLHWRLLRSQRSGQSWNLLWHLWLLEENYQKKFRKFVFKCICSCGNTINYVAFVFNAGIQAFNFVVCVSFKI